MSRCRRPEAWPDFADGCIPWLLHCRVLSRWPRDRSRTVAVQDSVRSRTPRLQEPAMLISDVLRTKGHHVVRIHTVDSVELAVRKLAEHRIGALVVEDRWMKPVGIFSERDFINAMARGGAGYGLLIRLYVHSRRI